MISTISQRCTQPYFCGEECAGWFGEYQNDYYIQQEDLRSNRQMIGHITMLMQPVALKWGYGLRRFAV
jgi:hypothetical protein